jgi:hypothetical protein
MRVVLTRLPGLTRKGLLTDQFNFQMPPQESFSVGYSAEHTDQQTIGGRTLSRPGAIALRTMNFSTLLLDYDAPFAVFHRGQVQALDQDPDTPDYTGVQAANLDFPVSLPDTISARGYAPRNPLVVRDDLIALLESRSPFRIMAGQPQVWGTWDYDMPVTLRTLDVREVSGEPDTRYVDVGFTEFVRPDLLTRKTKGTPKHHASLPATITVHASGAAVDSHGVHVPHDAGGVSLYDLAKFYYGSTAKWRGIAKANHLKSYSPSKGLQDYRGEGKPVGKLRIPKLKHEAN